MEARPGGQGDHRRKPCWIPITPSGTRSAARVLRNTMAQVALTRVDDRTEALRDSVSELLGMDEPRRRFGAMMSGLDIHYDLGEGHPLLGRRMPDLDLVTADGPLRVFALLHDARPVLLDLGDSPRLRHRAMGGSGPAGRRQLRRSVGASGTRGRRRSLGRADPARRIRGVGGGGDGLGLADALTTWFGPPIARSSPSIRRSCELQILQVGIDKGVDKSGPGARSFTRLGLVKT